MFDNESIDPFLNTLPCDAVRNGRRLVTPECEFR